MQGTRISFKSKEDAVHFAEKQGILLHASFSPLSDLPTFHLLRLGLLRTTASSEENPTQELRRKLCVPAEQASYCSHKIGILLNTMAFLLLIAPGHSILFPNPSSSYFPS